MSYAERYCGFVDILGFRQLVNGLSAEGEEWQSMRRLLERLHNPPKDLMSHHELTAGSDIRIQSISDAIAISTLPTPGGLYQMFNVLEDVALTFLIGGYFVRGAIVKGMLYHDEKMVFGEALTEAYRLESEIVRFPRIMVARKVAIEAMSHPVVGLNFKLHLKRAEDGPYFLDVLHKMVVKYKIETSQGEPLGGTDLQEFEFYIGCAESIQRRYDESADNPRHFEKVLWFARYWNATIREHGIKYIEKIKGPGIDPPPAVWG